MSIMSVFLGFLFSLYIYRVVKYFFSEKIDFKIDIFDILYITN
jgi:hypothetical protein